MAATKKLEVLITGNAKDAQKAFGDLERSATKSGKSTSKSLGGIKSGLVGLGIGAAALGSFKAFEESEKISRQTAAVIKSTGNEANVTEGHIGDLATEMSKLGGVDDELVQQGENMLLTFTNIRNEVGKGNDIFDQATLAANNYAAATGTDVVNANKMLGKALNDPIKGLTALTKAGVAFTQEQKSQIKAMVASGDMMGAQKIILAEFSKEYGGSLEANATASGKAQVAMENMGESVGKILAPAMKAGAEVVGGLAEAFSHLPEGAQTGIVAIGGLGAAAIVAGPRIASMYQTVAGGVSKLRDFATSTSQAFDSLAATRNVSKSTAIFESLKSSALPATSAIQSTVSAMGGMPMVGASAAAGVGLLVAAYVEMASESKKAKQGAQDLLDVAKTTGKTLDQAFDVQLANTIAGVDGGFRNLGDSGQRFGRTLHDAGISATELSKAVKGSDKDYKAFIERLRETDLTSLTLLRDDLDTMRRSALQAKDASSLLSSTQKELGVQTKDAADKTDDNTRSLKSLMATMGDQSSALGDLTSDVMRQVDAYGKLNSELESQIQNTYASIDAEMAARSAHDSVLDAQKALGEAQAGTARQRQEAEDGLTQAILREVQAADAAARASAEQAGKAYSAGDAANVQRAKLAELEKQTGFTSNELRWLGASLDNAARQRQVQLDTTQAIANIDRLIDKVSDLGALGSVLGAGGSIVDAGISGGLGRLGRASGGPVAAGSFNLVGEKGPELVRWGNNGTVIPAGKTKQMLSGTSVNAGTASMGGGATYYVTHINAPVYGIDDFAAKLEAAQTKRIRRTGRSETFNAGLKVFRS